MNILKRFTLLITILVGFFVVLAIPNTADAALFSGSKGEACKGANLTNDINGDKCSGNKFDENTNAGRTKVETTIGNIINLLTAIVGIVAVILIIINGLRFITSNGDSNSITSAKNGIIYAIVGLIIVALAQVIVRFVITRID